MVTQQAILQRKRVFSRVLKFVTAAVALGGIFMSFFETELDGFHHWSARLLYFTAQSNIWIGSVLLVIALFPNMRKEWKDRLYFFKYIFTVSITVTGIIFCGLLGPFSDSSFRSWGVSSLLSHVFSPVFAILDFFTDDYKIVLTKKHAWLSTLPFFLYGVVTFILEAFNVDYGRGDPYPYFFMYYRSPVGLFGFSNQYPFYAGSFYWIALFSLLVVGIGFLYLRLYEKTLSRE